jgi:phosphoenolpyruvate carboxylase
MSRDNIPFDEPYRLFLSPLRDKCRLTNEYFSLAVGNQDCPSPPKEILMSAQEIIDYLMVCYRSLIACGDESIANGRLRDLIWRLKAFGMTLVKLDIRQESSVHTDCLTEITEYLEMGSYKQWSETQKQEWILKGILS